KSLVLATIGIAFFLFMTLYLRQTLLFQGETLEEINLAVKLHKPPAAAVGLEPTDAAAASNEDEHQRASEIEFQIAFLIGLVGLGVGVGCSLAGYFSGNRLELGLVPLGAVLLILFTAAMAIAVPDEGK